jgi:glycopeptide antibiotics resistance protein
VLLVIAYTTKKKKNKQKQTKNNKIKGKVVAVISDELITEIP